MSQPARWLWGFVPLALLWGAGNLALDPAIERDVAARALRVVDGVAGKTPGARPIVAQVDGRDVTISGEVLSTDGATTAMAQLRGEFGVRRALGGLSQVVAQKPYSWFASRQGDSAVLGGFVPDLDTAAANRTAMEAALPGMRIADRQTVAFGAPEGFVAMTAAMITELPKLSSGRVTLDDGRFCIEGKAASPDAFLGLQAALAQPAQPGFRAVTCDLEPPAVSPYRWSAERQAGGDLILRGFYPGAEPHGRILAAIQRAFGSAVNLKDELKPALGAPATFLDKVARAVTDLARLSEGRAEITDNVYSLSGKGPDGYDACQALRLQIAQMDGPDSVAQVEIECPPPPPPPVPVVVPLPEMPDLILHDVLPAAPPAPAGAPPAPEPASPGTAPAPAVPPPAPAAPADTAKPAAVSPAPVPLDWSARRADGRVDLNGPVPSEAARAEILDAARRLFGGATIEDRMAIAPALRSQLDIPAATGFALEALSQLKAGSVTIRNDAFAIAGEAADAAGLAALRALLARGGPAGLALSALPDAVTVRPYGLALSASRSGLRFSGYLPDEETRRALQAQVAETPLKERFEDATLIVPGAPAGFGAAARAVLADLLRLDLGTASVEDDRVRLRGLTCRELMRSEIQTSATSGLPQGFKADVSIGLRETGCVADPPASCQNQLDGLTRGNTVLFGQGTTVVELDEPTERVIGEAAAILGKCAGSVVTIEGHANRDGEWRGYDNMDLSLRRALRVRDELERRGIDPAQLAVKAYGSTRPLVPYGEPEARAMNRRVQFTVAK
ncbi:hypothetical protein ARD30_00500 [Bosea thiooxidans]|uniref:Outer membrane protein OmpA n=1 Tax=Bosea thiooxidans TaxID=53254 RepID=A0A0Q3IBJ0_9HYPH|nr:OmpA family protein [Bosea thiooxidans]KQK32295.1 hypothetical protein ARD30_00500 [Bosea thiooxidans]SKC02444.1 Outer membrane protein OmpA [Bosea thiooxidans]